MVGGGGLEGGQGGADRRGAAAGVTAACMGGHGGRVAECGVVVEDGGAGTQRASRRESLAALHAHMGCLHACACACEHNPCMPDEAGR